MADTDNRGESKVKQQRLDEHKGLLGSVNIFLANIHKQQNWERSSPGTRSPAEPAGPVEGLTEQSMGTSFLPTWLVHQGGTGTYLCTLRGAPAKHIPQAGPMGLKKETLGLGLRGNLLSMACVRPVPLAHLSPRGWGLEAECGWTFCFVLSLF